MPFVAKRDLGEFGTLGIWELREEIDYFWENINSKLLDIDEYKSIKNPLRQREWLSVRLLIQQLEEPVSTSIIKKDKFGKPVTNEPNCHLSFSHNKEYAVVLVGKKEIGVDIEKDSERIFKIAKRFLSEKENNDLGVSAMSEELTRYWCAKEAIYKCFGKKDLNFRKHIEIEAFQSHEDKIISTGKLKRPDLSFNYSLEALEIKDNIIVCALKN